MIVPIVPVVSKDDQTIGTIIWKPGLKSRERHKIQRNKHVSKAFELADKYKYTAKVSLK